MRGGRLSHEHVIKTGRLKHAGIWPIQFLARNKI